MEDACEEYTVDASVGFTSSRLLRALDGASRGNAVSTLRVMRKQPHGQPTLSPAAPFEACGSQLATTVLRSMGGGMAGAAYHDSGGTTCGAGGSAS